MCPPDDNFPLKEEESLVFDGPGKLKEVTSPTVGDTSSSITINPGADNPGTPSNSDNINSNNAVNGTEDQPTGISPPVQTGRTTDLTTPLLSDGARASDDADVDDTWVSKTKK